MDVPVERTLIENVRREPTRYASDLAIYRHDPERYRMLEREDRLPSRVWWRWGEARIPERLAFVHREHGAELERRYRARPIAERALLGLAAGTGHLEEVERALDALRRRHDFPRRASFRYLVEGLPAGRISQIAAGFLTGRAAALEAYRRVRREHEREETEKRLRLLRELIGRWGRGGIEIVPIFERLSARYSPAQQVALRRALEARDAAEAEALFQRIEAENAEARMRAMEAAFVRFAEEWEAARDGSEQTPMQELSVPPTEPVDPVDADPAVAHLQQANPTVPVESIREWVESLRDRGVQIGVPGQVVPTGSVILNESEREDLGDWPFEMAGAFAYETADADEAGDVSAAEPRDAARLLVLDQAHAAEPSDEAGFVGRTTFVGDRGRFAPGTTPGLDRQVWGRWDHRGHWGHWGHERPWGAWRRIPYHYGHRWGDGGLPWYGIVDVPEYEIEDEAGYGGIGGNNTTYYLPPFPHYGGPPRPGRMAADGVYPFRELTRAMRLEHLAQLRNAYETGHPWPRFAEIEEQRLADAQQAREQFFMEVLAQGGCSPDAVGCSLAPEALAKLDALTADYTPEQKARLRQAVTGGEIARTHTPREVFQACEAENFREHRVDREPLFMRFDGERDRVRLGNPALLALASQTGDVAGPFDGDFFGAAKALGERALKAVGGVEGLKQLGARALGALRGAPAGPHQPEPGGAAAPFDVLPYVQRALQGLGHADLSNLGLPDLQGLLLGGAPGASDANEPAGDTGGLWDELRGLLGGGAPEAPGVDPTEPPPDDEPSEPFAPEQAVPRDGPRRSITKATYKVLAGDWPQKIAQKFGASKRRRWLAELYRANPHKTIFGGNWRTLAPGEIINIPDEWSSQPSRARMADETSEPGEARDVGDVGDALFDDEIAARVRDLLRTTRTPARDAQIVDTIADCLKGSTQARLESRDACFRAVLAAARAMYGHGFDPERLATGNPFLLFTHGMTPESARALRDALASGNDPLGVFRQLDQDHRARLIDECSRIATALLREGADRREERRANANATANAIERDRSTEAPEHAGHVEVAGPMPAEERPAPLYHLSLPPLHPRAFAALLEAVPALQMQPDAIKAEIAGWRGQSGDTSGVDAVTQEYVALPGETLRSIAQKLVGDGDRWIELDACNPARRPGDPRLRLPPNWFAYIPYAAPSDAIADLAHDPALRRIMAGGDVGDETGSLESDRAALEALEYNPLLRRILLAGGSVFGTTLRGLLARGELIPAIRRNPLLQRVVGGGWVKRWFNGGWHNVWRPGWRGGWRGRWDTGEDAGADTGLIEAFRLNPALRHPGWGHRSGHHHHHHHHHHQPWWDSRWKHHWWETGEAGDPDAGDPLADEAALIALRTNWRLRRVLLEGGSVNGVTLKGLLRRRRLHPGWIDVFRYPALRRVIAWEVAGPDTADTGAAAGSPSALATLLAQIDARWPLRKRGMHDGLESHEQGTALRITEDTRLNGPYRMGPDIVALSFVLRTDPRLERTEIQKPSLWNAVDVPYLKVIVRPGLLADDPSPWDLSALDTRISPEAGETGAPERTYVAQDGETPQMIARRFNVLDREGWQGELRAANPQRDWYARIHSGDVVKIPASWPNAVDTGEDAEAGVPERKYVAAGRETAQTIAARHNALGRSNWAAELRAANPGRDWYAPIYPGEVLTIPAQWPIERTYVVQSGDFAQTIAGKCGGLDRLNWWSELAAANPQKEVIRTSTGPSWASLRAGEVINIPVEWTAFEAGDADEAGAVVRRGRGAGRKRRGRRGGRGRRYVSGRRGVDFVGGGGNVEINVHVPEGEEEEYEEDVDTGAGEGSDRATLTGRTYAVVLGDYPQGIAKKLGAFPARSTWWNELKAANPHKKTGPKGWASLNAGEIINIPDEWPQSSLLRPAPGASPNPPAPAPAPPATPPPRAPRAPVPEFDGPTGPISPAPKPEPGFVLLAATVDPGTIARVHSELAAWNLATPGACNPADFGRGPNALADVSGTLTERAQHATQSFQVWTNAQRGTRRKLRSDGALDPATAEAVDAWFQSKATPPGPMPTPGRLPMPEVPPAPIPMPGPLPVPEMPRAEPPPRVPEAPRRPRGPKGPGAPRAPGGPGVPRGPGIEREPGGSDGRDPRPAREEPPPAAPPPPPQEAPPAAKAKPKAGASDDEVIGIAATLATVLGGFFPWVSWPRARRSAGRITRRSRQWPTSP